MAPFLLSRDGEEEEGLERSLPPDILVHPPALFPEMPPTPHIKTREGGGGYEAREKNKAPCPLYSTNGIRENLANLVLSPANCLKIFVLFFHPLDFRREFKG
jgi:hypothetical protein